MQQKEREWIIEHAKRPYGVVAFHLNNDFAKYCDLFSVGYNKDFTKGQKRLRQKCNELEKEGIIYSEIGGTGIGGYSQFGVRSYKSWHFVESNKNE